MLVLEARPCLLCCEVFHYGEGLPWKNIFFMVLAINAANRDIKGRSPMPHHTPTLNKIFGPKIAHLPALGFRSERCLGFHTPPKSISKRWQIGNFWPKKFVKGRGDQRCQCPVWYETWKYLLKKVDLFLVLLNPLVLSLICVKIVAVFDFCYGLYFCP